METFDRQFNLTGAKFEERPSVMQQIANVPGSQFRSALLSHLGVLITGLLAFPVLCTVSETVSFLSHTTRDLSWIFLSLFQIFGS